MADARACAAQFAATAQAGREATRLLAGLVGVTVAALELTVGGPARGGGEVSWLFGWWR